MARNDFGYAAARRATAEQAKERKKHERHGVFVWREDNRYRAADAVKIYKSKSAAQNFADLNYVLNYVVRPVDDA